MYSQPVLWWCLIGVLRPDSVHKYQKKIQVKVIEVHLSSRLKEKKKKAFVCLLACENRRFSTLLAALEVLPRETSAHQQQKLHTDDVFGIWSGALIGRRSSYIVLAIVYEWQTKDRRPQRSKVSAMNLKQNCQHSWNIVLEREETAVFAGYSVTEVE